MAQTVRTLVTKEDFIKKQAVISRFNESITVNPIQNIEVYPLVSEYREITTSALFLFFENAFTLGDGLGGLYVKSNDTNADDIGMYITVSSKKYRRINSGVVLLDWFDTNFSSALVKASKYYAVECSNKVYHVDDTINLNITTGLTLDLQGATLQFTNPIEYCFTVNVLKNKVLNITNGNIEILNDSNLVNVANLIKTNSYVDLLTNMTFNTDKIPDTTKLIDTNEEFRFKASKHIETLEYTGTEDLATRPDNSVMPLIYTPNIDDSDCIKLREPLGNLVIPELIGKLEGIDNQGCISSQVEALTKAYAKDYLDNYYRNNKAFTTTAPGGYYTVPKGVVPTLQGQWAKYTYTGIPDTIDVYSEAIANIEFTTVTEILMDEGELDKPIYVRCSFIKPLNGNFQLTEVECEEAKEMCVELSPLTADSFKMLRIENFIADLGEVIDSYGGLAGCGLSIRLPDKPEFYLGDKVVDGTTSVSSIKEFYIKCFVIEGTYGYGASLAGYDAIQAEFMTQYQAQIEAEFAKAQAGNSSWVNNLMAAVGWQYFAEHYGQQLANEFKIKMTQRLNESYTQGGLTSKIKFALKYRSKLSYSNEINLYIARLIPKEGLDANKEHKYYSKYTLSADRYEAEYGYPSQYFYYNNTPITLKISQEKIDNINKKYVNMDWLLANGFVGSRRHGPYGAPYDAIEGVGCCSGGFHCGINGTEGPSFRLIGASRQYITLHTGLTGPTKRCVYNHYYSFGPLLKYYYPQLFEDDVKPCGYYTTLNFKAFVNMGPTEILPGNYGVGKFLLKVYLSETSNSTASISYLIGCAKSTSCVNAYSTPDNYGSYIEPEKNHNYFAINKYNGPAALDTYPSKSKLGKVEPKWKGSVRAVMVWWGDCHNNWSCGDHYPTRMRVAKETKVDPKLSYNSGYFAAGDLLGIQLSIVNGIGKNRLFDKVFGKGNWDFNDDLEGCSRFLESNWEDDTTRVAWRKPGAHVKCCDSMPRGNNTYTNDFTTDTFKHYKQILDPAFAPYFIKTEE